MVRYVLWVELRRGGGGSMCAGIAIPGREIMRLHRWWEDSSDFDRSLQAFLSMFTIFGYTYASMLFEIDLVDHLI